MSITSAAVLRGEPGHAPDAAMRGGGALGAAVGGVLVRMPFCCTEDGLTLGKCMLGKPGARRLGRASGGSRAVGCRECRPACS